MPPLGPETLTRVLERADFKTLAASPDKGCRDLYARFVGKWLVFWVKSLSPFRSPSAAAAFDRDPDAGAVALISAIRDYYSKAGLADSIVPVTVEFLWDGEAFQAAADQRTLGRIDDADATAARLMALARRLVQVYPDDAHSYRLLSDAHNQIKKNAIHTHDDELTRESFVKAIEAIRQALALDPERLEGQRHLDKLIEQFARFKPNATEPHRKDPRAEPPTLLEQGISP